MHKVRYLKIALLQIMLIAGHSSYAANHLKPMTDEQMANTTGQALMSLSYIAPNDTVNLETHRSGGDTGIGFYKLGLEAELEINANIKKLQLGCGGVKGAGCDIDIDYLSLSGISDTNTGRASSSAKLVNPFVEFAIKNPNSVATRQVTGLRLSSEAAYGMISFGLENAEKTNADGSKSGIPSGINSLSGYLVVAATGGTVNVNSISNLTQAETGTAIKGKACDSYLGACGLIRADFTTNDYNLNLDTSNSTSKLTLVEQAITGSRISSYPLLATALVSGINLSGTVDATAKVLGIGIPLSGDLSGTVNNLNVDVTINESLGLFHKADLNGTPMSIALQSKGIMWPGTKSIAQQGWWLELSNPIEIGDITPSNNVDIAMNTIKDTLGLVGQYLTDNPIKCGALTVNCLVVGKIDTGAVNLINSSHAAMTLTDVSLAKQSFAPNCHGNLKFC